MYVYAFLKKPASELTLPSGIEGNLQIISTNSLAAVAEPELASIEEIQEEESRLMQAVLTHDRILCQLFSQISILPLRFGTVFTSREYLLTHLTQRKSEYLEKLQQVEGKAEYTLKAIPVEAPVASVDPEAKGKSYLLAKKKRYQAFQEFQAQQNLEWESLREEIVQTYHSSIIIGEPQQNTQRLYLLISQDLTSLLSKNIQAWQQSYPSWQLELGSPLPPYHFV